jgi:hypothetical protein
MFSTVTVDRNKRQAMIDGIYAPPQQARGTAFEEIATLFHGKYGGDQNLN